MRSFLLKDNPELPDSYGALITFIDGRKEEYEIASHTLSSNGTRILDFVTVDDEIYWLPLENIKTIKFDKRFSKIVFIRNEEIRKENTEGMNGCAS